MATGGGGSGPGRQFPPAEWSLKTGIATNLATVFSDDDHGKRAWSAEFRDTMGDFEPEDGALPMTLRTFMTYDPYLQLLVCKRSTVVKDALLRVCTALKERDSPAVVPTAPAPALPSRGGNLTREQDERHEGHYVVLINKPTSLNSSATRPFPTTDLPRVKQATTLTYSNTTPPTAAAAPPGPEWVCRTVGSWLKTREPRRRAIDAAAKQGFGAGGGAGAGAGSGSGGRAAASSSAPSTNPVISTEDLNSAVRAFQSSMDTKPDISTEDLDSAMRAAVLSIMKTNVVIPMDGPDPDELAAVLSIMRWPPDVFDDSPTELAIERIATSRLIVSALRAVLGREKVHFRSDAPLTGHGFLAAVKDSSMNIYHLDALKPDLCIVTKVSRLVLFLFEAKASSSKTDHRKGLALVMAGLLRYMEASERDGADPDLANTVLPLVRIEGYNAYIEACWLEAPTGEWPYHVMRVAVVERCCFDLRFSADRLRFNEVMFNISWELSSRLPRLSAVRPVTGKLTDQIPAVSVASTHRSTVAASGSRTGGGTSDHAPASTPAPGDAVSGAAFKAVGLKIIKTMPTKKAHVVTWTADPVRGRALLAKVLTHKYAESEMEVANELATASPALFVSPVGTVKVSDKFSVLLLPYVENIYPDDNGGPVIIPDILQAAHDLLTAVSTMAEHKVLHRDLKARNVLWLSDGHVKVVDFDIAKRLVGQYAAGATSFCGTDGWRAPEVEAVKTAQDAGEAPVPYSNPVDVWGVGKVLKWAMGKVGASVVVPDELVEVANAMCSPDPEHRPTAAKALEEVHAMLCPKDKPESPMPPSSVNPGGSPGKDSSGL